MNKPYILSSALPIVSHAETKQSHHYTIRDLPAEEKPREKLLNQGVANLTLPELMAVLLNVGTVKEDVLSMAQRISRDYGEKSLASARDPKKLAADLDIPVMKANQIVAALELGRRLYERNPHGVKIIRTAEDVFEYAKGMIDLPKEHLRGIYLNSHYKVIHDEIISIGTIDASIIHPREVFKPALEYSAVAVILVHNHPSGETLPSDADREVTRQLQEVGTILGIELIDHVIVSRQGFTSILNR